MKWESLWVHPIMNYGTQSSGMGEEAQQYGAWDYASNQQVIDRFFREGMERAADTKI